MVAAVLDACMYAAAKLWVLPNIHGLSKGNRNPFSAGSALRALGVTALGDIAACTPRIIGAI